MRDHDMKGCISLRAYLDQGDGGRLAGVTSVLLEREPEDGDLLVRDRVEQLRDNALHEPFLLVLVHDDHLVPVGSDLGQVEGLSKVRQVEDVFLEAGTAEADRGLEELGANASVLADSVGDLVNVGARGLADGGEGVDGGDALGEEGIGSLDSDRVEKNVSYRPQQTHAASLPQINNLCQNLPAWTVPKTTGSW
ncbi:hypothetical protein BC938DRAFT_482319 [Jimgerdemannia flammicorona]|uniref:Uncharacterized protein n=1 Tax=Jimgerdemannia flammicorona TaxID=994334 RepID=A0A433QWC7_9FUNG|nr:hypothetical protein BC938DRAFT_482319 [Jimgerdemannia flammicorona]